MNPNDQTKPRPNGPNQNQNRNQQQNRPNNQPNRQQNHNQPNPSRPNPQPGQGQSANPNLNKGIFKQRRTQQTDLRHLSNKPEQRQNRTGLTKLDAGVLKVIPLGGLGKIGKNMMALEYENDIIVVDMGFMFPRADTPGVDYVIPDTTYLEDRKHKIRAHLITHAHEDHVGGIPFILPKLPAPIYGSRFTINYIEKKLEEFKLTFSPQMRVIDPEKHERIQLGAFTVEFVRVVHAIPDPCAIVIDTPVGRLVHSGDWRFDDTPIDGRVADKARLAELGKEGTLMLMSDSTGCENMGASPTELEIQKTFEQLLTREQNKRIIISSFSSQINRVQLIINAAQQFNRKVAFVGRSMLANVEMAIKLGYIKIPPGILVKIQDAVKLPDSQIVIISTGNQGEENSALLRMAHGDHAQVKLKRGDVIIMSSSIIPGNEMQVYAAVDDLMREGAKVYQQVTHELDDCGIMHVSGHAYRDELVEMIKLTKPTYYLPIHGEYHHLVHHAELARKNGIAEKNAFLIEDGQTIEFSKNGGKLGKKIPVVNVMIDGSGIGDVQNIVLRDRLAMSSDGMFVIIATVARASGKLVTSPDIISRGFIYMKDNEDLIRKARGIIKNIFDKRDISTPANLLIIKTRMREELSNYLYKMTKRNPIILPVVIEV